MTQIPSVSQTPLRLAHFFIDCSANSLYLWQRNPLNFSFLPCRAVITASKKKRKSEGSRLHCKWCFSARKNLKWQRAISPCSAMCCIYVTFESCWFTSHHVCTEFGFAMLRRLLARDLSNNKKKKENKKIFATGDPRKPVSCFPFYWDTFARKATAEPHQHNRSEKI